MPALSSWLQPWLFWALASAVFASMTAIFGKIGVQGVDADFATLIRVIVILAFISGIVLVRGVAQPLASIAPKTWIFLVLSGAATGFSWLCYYRALQLGPAAQVAPIDKLSVVLVAVFGVLLLGEHLNWKNWLGVGAIGMGALLVSLKS